MLELHACVTSVCQFFFTFACAQRSSWTSVCVSMHQSWARIPSVDFFLKTLINQELRVKCVLNWNKSCRDIVSGWRSVIAVLLRVGCSASLICTCTYKTEHTPRLCMLLFRDCGPAKSNMTGQNVCSSARLYARIAMCMKYTRWKKHDEKQIHYAIYSVKCLCSVPL